MKLPAVTLHGTRREDIEAAMNQMRTAYERELTRLETMIQRLTKKVETFSLTNENRVLR